MIEPYQSNLNLYETQNAIGYIKQTFQFELSRRLHLIRATAPLFVDPATGLNDDLSGVERPVAFDIPGVPGVESAQVVHSLAKWKRQALGKYGFQPDTGLWTDMNAIRRDEEPDELHSIYVDQWDWEKIIEAQDRTVDYLKATVRDIVGALRDTQSFLRSMFPQLCVLPEIPAEITFITTQELEDLYPDLTPKQREHAFVKDHPVTFLMGIGGKLKSGKPHDGRAPDYDDWSLNGDIMLWDEVLGHALEISSMGIRVDAEAMLRQLKIRGCEQRAALPFHASLLRGELPLTIGGGIGQSRLCMLMMGCAHIGEVQSSIWDDRTICECKAAGIKLL